jgi:hypothetical protein
VINRDSIYPLGSAPFDFTLIILARLFSIEFAYIISIICRGDCDILVYASTPVLLLLPTLRDWAKLSTQTKMGNRIYKMLVSLTFPLKKFR